MPWKHNGKIIKAGRSWSDSNGVQHPATWMRWSDAEKTAAGLVWEADPAPYDDRFYWDANTPKNIADVNEVDGDGNAILDEDGNQLVTKGLKTQAIEQVKAEAKAKLAETDWMIIKSVEDSTFTVPQSVLTYRAAVRTASNTIETSITNAADHTAFRALYDHTEDDDGNQVVAPIADWPDEA